MNQFLSYATIRQPEQVAEASKFSLNQSLEILIESKDLFDCGLLPELQALLGERKGADEYQLLVDIYLSCLPQRLDEINLAFDSEDWHTLHRLFHNFKVSSCYVGGHYLSWLSENLGETIMADLRRTERFISKFESFHLEVYRLKQHLESIFG